MSHALHCRNVLIDQYVRRFIILQGLSGTATGFLAYVTLAIYYVKLYLTGSTPRSIYNIKYKLGSVQFGTAFPAVTLLACISTLPLVPLLRAKSATYSRRTCSPRVLGHRADHQWPRGGDVLPVLHSLEVSIPLAAWPAALD